MNYRGIEYMVIDGKYTIDGYDFFWTLEELQEEIEWQRLWIDGKAFHDEQGWHRTDLIQAWRDEWQFEFVEGSTDQWTMTISKWEEDDMGIGAWVPYSVTHFMREDSVRELVRRLEAEWGFKVA